MKITNLIKYCINYKVLIGIALAILGIYLYFPQFARFSWILLVLACPLSMIFMMSRMQNTNKDETKKDLEIKTLK